MKDMNNIGMSVAQIWGERFFSTKSLSEEFVSSYSKAIAELKLARRTYIQDRDHLFQMREYSLADDYLQAVRFVDACEILMEDEMARLVAVFKTRVS